MKLQAITENEYSGLEDADEFRSSGPDFMARDGVNWVRMLGSVVSDLHILAKETDELQTQWDRQRAASIVRMLGANASLLNMLVDSDV